MKAGFDSKPRMRAAYRAFTRPRFPLCLARPQGSVTGVERAAVVRGKVESE